MALKTVHIVMRSTTTLPTLFLLCISSNASAQAGEPDYSFFTGNGFDGRIWSIDTMDDGRILAGGDFTNFQNTAAPHVIRLWPTGERDMSFAFPGTDTSARAVACLPTGGSLVGGYFNSPSPHLVRLLENGSPDPGFDIGAGPDSAVLTLALLEDGRCIVGGRFNSMDGQPRSRLARINVDGSNDPEFLQYGSGLNGEVRAIAVQSDGRIVVGGGFTMYDGTVCGGLIRLLPDGQPDPEFVAGTGSNATVWCIAESSDGGCFVGGEFTEWNGQPIAFLAHLLSDGSLDSAYPNGASPNGPVLALSSTSDDRLLMGGMFTAVGTFPRNRIARLLPNGAMDATFVTGGGFGGFSGYTQVCDLLQSQGDRVYVAGRFGNYQNFYVNMLCRLHNEVEVAVPDQSGDQPARWIAHPGVGKFELFCNSEAEVEVLDAMGRCFLRSMHRPPSSIVDIGARAAGMYFISTSVAGERMTWRVHHE